MVKLNKYVLLSKELTTKIKNHLVVTTTIANKIAEDFSYEEIVEIYGTLYHNFGDGMSTKYLTRAIARTIA